LRFLSDERLYSDTEHCLEFLRALSDDPPGAVGAPEPFHLYWSGPLSTKVAFSIKSFLVTQDPARSELWLWLDAKGHRGHEDQPLLRPLLPHVRVRRFDPNAEAKGTPFAGKRRLRGRSPTPRSDFVRLVVLYNDGGTYVDADTMFLRDLGPLSAENGFAREFCYRWSVDRPYGNGAVLRLRPRSETATSLLARCIVESSCHPHDAFRFEGGEALDLLVLPCVIFDPLWPHHDRKNRYLAAPYATFGDFFRPFDGTFRRDEQIRSYRDFFHGAFTYHWHNFWGAPEYRDSYFGLFNEEFDAVLRERLRRP
jgi:hypothetical protein